MAYYENDKIMKTNDSRSLLVPCGRIALAGVVLAGLLLSGCGGNSDSQARDGGAAALVSQAIEPPGPNCANGGARVDAGIDSNRNEVLDAGEVDSTTYVCHDAVTPDIQIRSLTAMPAVTRPGEATVLTVSVDDAEGASLTYAWSAEHGSFSDVTSNPVVWTAPATAGRHLLRVDVSDGDSTTTAYASILVSVSPAGPVITSVTPYEAKAGEEVRISGAGFGDSRGGSTLTIGGKLVTAFSSWTDDEIMATVPSGAATGTVVANVAGVDSSGAFLVVPWAAENPVNVPVSTGQYTRAHVSEGPRVATDGDGGAIIAWERKSSDADIYAQRLDRTGTPVWAANGVAVSTAAAIQERPQIVADGSGGAIIAWTDYRDLTVGDVYVQRIDGSGNVLWTANGVGVTATADTNDDSPQLAPDGSGGAIIVWRSAFNLHAQRLDADGNRAWPTDAVISASGDTRELQVIADGAGGAIIVWTRGAGGHEDLYAQRIGSTGNALWALGGVVVSNAAAYQRAPQAVSDDNGGAIIAWEDGRSGTTAIYSQRLDSDGNPLWAASGLAVSAGAEIRRHPQLAPDGSGGAIIAWEDFRSGGYADIYAQRLDGSGNGVWTEGGIAVATSADTDGRPHIAADGNGGAIIAWSHGVENGDVYAQRLSSSGNTLWNGAGVAVSTALAAQVDPRLIADGNGGAVVVWWDERAYGSDSNAYHIYAQGITAGGRQ